MSRRLAKGGAGRQLTRRRERQPERAGAKRVARSVFSLVESATPGSDTCFLLFHPAGVFSSWRVSSELKHSYPGIPWADTVEFRNIAVHAYFSVDWRLVWNAAVSDAPTLKCAIEAIVKARHVPQMQVKPGR